MMNITIDENYTLQKIVDLVQIDSTNPRLSPEGKGEGWIQLGS